MRSRVAIEVLGVIVMICLAFTPVPLVGAWDGNWTVLLRADHLYEDCFPIEPYVAAVGRQKLDSTKKLLRVYITASSQIVSMTSNLVESLLMAFPAHPTAVVLPQYASTATSPPNNTKSKSEMSLASCRRWTVNGSLDFWKNKFASQSDVLQAVRKQLTHSKQAYASPAGLTDTTSSPPPFPFSGLCIGIRKLKELPPATTEPLKAASKNMFALRKVRAPDATTTTTSNEHSIAPGKTAKFGSPDYYNFLEQKLRYFTRRIMSFTNTSSRVSPWALMIDADAQVFPGFFDMIGQKVLCPYVELQCEHSNYLGGCAGAVASMSASRKATMPKVDVFYQRESRRLVNTGVALVNMNSPGSLCVYHEAVRRMQRSLFGDQTAIQLVLKQRRGFCATRARQGVPASFRNQARDTFSLVRHDVHHQVFNKMHVNGNALNVTYLAAHHAHMAGSQKVYALKKVLSSVKAAVDTARLQHGATVHTGMFLDRMTTDTLCTGTQLSHCLSRVSDAPVQSMVCCVLRGNLFNLTASATPPPPSTAARTPPVAIGHAPSLALTNHSLLRPFPLITSLSKPQPKLEGNTPPPSESHPSSTQQTTEEARPVAAVEVEQPTTIVTPADANLLVKSSSYSPREPDTSETAVGDAITPPPTLVTIITTEETTRPSSDSATETERPSPTSTSTATSSTNVAEATGAVPTSLKLDNQGLIFGRRLLELDLTTADGGPAQPPGGPRQKKDRGADIVTTNSGKTVDEAVVSAPPSSCSPNDATCNDSSTTTTVAPKKPRRFKKSKALWTALPAIFIIITLTMFHYFVLNPTPPEDYTGVAPTSPRPHEDEERELQQPTPRSSSAPRHHRTSSGRNIGDGTAVIEMVPQLRSVSSQPHIISGDVTAGVNGLTPSNDSPAAPQQQQRSIRKLR